MKEFQWFSGLTGKAAKEAASFLDIQEVEQGSGRMLLASEFKEWNAFQVPSAAQFELVSSLDGIGHLRRDAGSLFAEQDRNRELMTTDGKRVSSGGLSDLPGHAILDRGRVVGLWEYDPDAAQIVYASFIGKPKGLTTAVHETEAFIRQDLADFRSFSLDSPKSRVPRIEYLRKAATA